MIKKSLTDKLRTGFYTGLAAGVLGLTGCGGGPGNQEPIPPVKSLFQTADLVNDIDIRYCATLENVSSATRTTYRDGTEIGQKTITESYCEPLEGLTKGNYKFDLTASNVTPHSIEVKVPNYNPVDLNNLNLNMKPNSVLDVVLQNPTDKNPEDNPVFYNFAESLDGKVKPTLGISSGITTPLRIESGVLTEGYEIKLSFGDVDGGQGSKIHKGRIAPEQIAYWKDVNGNEDIHIADLDLVNGALKNVRRLTKHPRQDLHPSWSPDGNQLAFITTRDGNASIYKIDHDGINLEKVTPPINTDFFNPSWSPDGTEIAFAYIDRDLATNGIAKINVNGIINADGSILTKLIENPGTGTSPAGTHWFKDGRIFYSDHADGSFELFSMDSNGNFIVRFTNTPYNETLPKVSPDGSTLVFISDEFGGEFSGLEIMSMTLDGTNIIKRITSTFQMEVDATYSNNGTKLLYSRWLGGALGTPNPGHWQLHLANSDGTGEILINTDEESRRYAVFRPN